MENVREKHEHCRFLTFSLELNVFPVFFRVEFIPILLGRGRFGLKYLPYRAKLCRAKFSSGNAIRRAKFLSPNEKFITFAQRKILPDKSKSVFS